MTWLKNAFAHYKTTLFGAIAAAATSIALQHGPHSADWTKVAAVATLLLGGSAADAGKGA